MRPYVDSATINGQFFRNGSTTGWPVKTEIETLPELGNGVMELDEVIHPASINSATLNDVPAELVPYSFTPATGEIAVSRALGLIKYNVAADGGKELKFTFTPAGTRVTAGKFADIADGLVGPGVPIGGLANQILAKASDDDYDTEWVDKPSGSGDITIDDVDGLQDALNGKSDTGHDHDDRYYTTGEMDTSLGGITSALDGKANQNGTTFPNFIINSGGDHTLDETRITFGSTDFYIGYNGNAGAWQINFDGDDWEFGGTAYGDHGGDWVGNAIPGNKLSAYVMFTVNHGGTAGTTRPDVPGAVTWIGSVEPTNAVNGDVWVETA